MAHLQLSETSLHSEVEVLQQGLLVLVLVVKEDSITVAPPVIVGLNMD